MRQRRRTRVNSQKPATVSVHDAHFEAVVDNISLKGCLLRLVSDPVFPIDHKLEVHIHLDPQDHHFDIHALGKVVRHDGDTMAIDFDEITPESFGHLFRLVQHNSEHPEDIELELTRAAYNPNDRN